MTELNVVIFSSALLETQYYPGSVEPVPQFLARTQMVLKIPSSSMAL